MTVLDSKLEQAQVLLTRFQQEPEFFISSMLHSDLWDLQIKIAHSVRDNRYTAVKACHGPGKTFLAAQLVLWWLYSFVPSKVITTAPTNRQIEGLLWSEIRAAHERAKQKNKVALGPEPLKKRLELRANHFAEGFAVKDYETERFQGYHSDNILIIVDEASGVPDSIFDSIEGLMSAGNARLLLIGNPNRSYGKFYEAFQNPLYKKFTISAFDTPNFTEFGITKADIVNGDWVSKLSNSALPRSYLINPRWVYERFVSWGTNSLLSRVRIFGEFPPSDSADDKVIPASYVLDVQDKEYEHDKFYSQIHIGVDPARFGNDQAVIAIRAGRAALKEVTLAKRDTMEIVGRVVEETRNWKAERIHTIQVDSIGLGAGPVDRLKELQREGVIPPHTIIKGINVAKSSRNKKEYYNLRDESWFLFSKLLKDDGVGGKAISDTAIQEFTEVKYSIDSKGRRRVEPKEELKKRIKRSSDRADAWILAYIDLPDEGKSRSKIRASSSLLKHRKKK